MNCDPLPNPQNETESPVSTLAWNQATRSFSATETLHRWFERVSEEYPDSIALTFEGQQLTYADVNTRANQLAHHLRSRGVGPEMLVALCLERSFDLIIGILGILKVGAAYVPCDPEVPAERLAFILEDTQSPVLITQESLLSRLAAPASQVVCLDRDRGTLSAQSGANPDAPHEPDHVAYVIYTSGSTGQPKGVCVTHHNAVRLFAATEDWFHFGPEDVWTLFHSFAFDFSVWEIWGALLYGGRLVVVPHLVTRAPDSFLDLLAEEKVTVINQTPSAFRQLIATESAVPAPRPLALRYVIFGGEALDLAALRPWFQRHGDTRPQLINMYGITETTVHVTYRPLTADDVAEQGSVIGRAIPDLDLYVLDAELRPCPIGETGELHVGGAGLAVGYLRRPELTAQRFFDNPHKPGGRLYKSGDLARYRPDGDIEYLGRIDHQVKIRGHRVELGEIEARIRDFPGVLDAVVLLREVSPDDQQLCGYIVAPSLDTVALRDFLKTRLPAYMLPAGFVRLDRLPLTTNGKLDQKALPLPTIDRAAQRAPFAAPQAPLEKQIATVWQDVLGIEAAGLDDNFFDLGGTSLLMLRVHSHLRAAAGREVRIVELFQYPTIRALATHWKSAATSTISAAVSRAHQRAALIRSRLARPLVGQE